MSDTKILRAIGGIDDAFVERASQKKMNKGGAFPLWLKWAVPVAACLLIAVMVAMPLLNKSGAFDLTLSSGVSVRYMDHPPVLHSSSSLVYLTEEELFAEYSHGYEIVIFGGTVKGVNNIVIDFNGHEDYRAIAEIEVNEVLRGSILTDSVVTVLLPAPVNMDGYWVSDTSVSSQITPGKSGYFMPMRYDETSVIMMNEATLVLSEIAEYGLSDGERWVFLETTEGLVFSRWAYESIAGAKTIDEVGQYIITMINQE